MTIQNSTFGFIDYFIAGTRQRIACQFFRLGNDMVARLDPSGTNPMLTAIAPPMRAEVLGAFPSVLERYTPESGLVLSAENFWDQCETEGGDALKFFQVVHHMRLCGATVSEGIDAAINLGQRLRASESNAVRAIHELFASDIGQPGLEGVPQQQPTSACVASLPRISCDR